MEEGRRDQGKVFEEISVFASSYDFNNLGKDLKRKNGRHCGTLNVELYRYLVLVAEYKAVGGQPFELEEVQVSLYKKM